ncbi:MAG: hypothetical protein GY815_13265 [Gammaproteobacteria bacterium]|nr:hypothetical protein [Gammaproteobacteria bacterium]
MNVHTQIYKQQKRAIQEGRNSGSSKCFVRLSPGQLEILNRALQELAEAGNDTSGCSISKDSIRSLDGDLAAQILILIHHRYKDWLKIEGTSIRQLEGARRRVCNLYKKLLPLAKEQVLILKRESRHSYSDDQDECIIVYLSAHLVKRIAYLHQLVRENKLAYLVCELSKYETANLIHHLPVYSLGAKADHKLCISDQEIWFECSINNSWGKEQFATSAVLLNEVVPVNLLSVNSKEIGPVLARKSLRPFMERINALRDADRAYEVISEAVWRLDSAVPNEHLALVETLVDLDKEKPFRTARRALEEIESDLETWEKNLELEKSEICCQALGVGLGDDLMCEIGGKSARIRLKGASLHMDDEGVYFHLWGKRFRKDGILGKRDEYFVLQVRIQ